MNIKFFRQILKNNLNNVPIRRIGLFESTRKEITNEVNKLPKDLDKILLFQKITNPNGKFVVIDKVQSKLHLYKGTAKIQSYKVGVGETAGDSLNSVEIINGKLGKEGKYTPSGQFCTRKPVENIADKEKYKNGQNLNIILLDGVQHPASYKYNTSIALHQIPNDEFIQRSKLFSTNQNRRNGMSTGCINLTQQDFEKAAQKIPEGTNVYILPEESKNSLELITLPNEKLWFKTNFADQKRSNILDEAIKHFFKK